MGLPGSGKTTHLKPWAQKNGILRICPDEHFLRCQMQKFDLESNAIVWQSTFDQLGCAAENNECAVLDAVNLIDYHRKNLLIFCQQYYVNIIGMLFVAPISICWQRNNDREGHHVPREAFDAMVKTMTMPVGDEGFSKILVIKNY